MIQYTPEGHYTFLWKTACPSRIIPLTKRHRPLHFIKCYPMGLQNVHKKSDHILLMMPHGKLHIMTLLRILWMTIVNLYQRLRMIARRFHLSVTVTRPMPFHTPCSHHHLFRRCSILWVSLLSGNGFRIVLCVLQRLIVLHKVKHVQLNSITDISSCLTYCWVYCRYRNGEGCWSVIFCAGAAQSNVLLSTHPSIELLQHVATVINIPTDFWIRQVVDGWNKNESGEHPPINA